MTVQLDHTIVPSRNKAAAAKRLAELPGVPWAEKGMGPFSAVYVKGADDMQVSREYGNVYWNEPDGHQWELLTVSYARPHG